MFTYVAQATKSFIAIATVLLLLCVNREVFALDVSLEWEASPDAQEGLTYTVYWNLEEVSPSSFAGSQAGIAATTAVVPNLEVDKRWCFVATARFANGPESLPSNVVCALLTPPATPTPTPTPTLPPGVTPTPIVPDFGAPTGGACGDFDGDHISDLGYAVPTSTGKEYTYHLLLSDGRYLSRVANAVNAKAVPADYDGDGKFDLAMVSKSKSGKYVWSIQGMESTAANSVVFKAPIDKFIAGCDFNADGQADVAGFSSKKKTLYYASVAEAKAAKMQKAKFKFKGDIVDLSCNDFDDKKGSELVILSNPNDKAKTTLREIRVLTLAGKELMTHRQTRGADGLLLTVPQPGAEPVVAFYARKKSSQPVRALSFILKDGSKFKVAPLRFSAARELNFGLFIRQGSANKIEPFFGLSLLSSRGALSYLDLGNPQAGTVSALADTREAVQKFAGAIKKKGGSLLKCVTAGSL